MQECDWHETTQESEPWCSSQEDETIGGHKEKTNFNSTVGRSNNSKNVSNNTCKTKKDKKTWINSKELICYQKKANEFDSLRLQYEAVGKESKDKSVDIVKMSKTIDKIRKQQNEILKAARKELKDIKAAVV